MLPKLYDTLASWWPLFSPPEEYVEEAAFFAKTLRGACTSPARSLLELGSGGGNNASHMKAAFDAVTLVDPAPGMLAHSRALNPECEHLEGDMRTLRLGREFDRVFVHDAIAYMTTEADLRRAIETAYIHCKEGGAALFAPDHLRESFEGDTEHGGSDDGPRGFRYLAWVWDPDPTDTTYVVDYAVVLREADGTTRVEHDRHLEGLFSRADWLRILTEVGFTPLVVPFDHSELEPGVYQLFVGVK